jgi:hypothetical protein
MRVVPGLLALLLVGLPEAGCSRDLDGFSSGDTAPAPAGSGPVLRTQANAKGTQVTSFELTPSGGTREGDLLWYVVLSLGGKIKTPPELNQVEAIENKCIPSAVWIYSRTATESMQATQKFELDAPGDINATVLVIGGVDPTIRSQAVRGSKVDEASFQPDPISVGSSDAPAHVLFTALFTETDGPPGGTLLASNATGKFFTFPVANAGPLTPPAMPLEPSCATIGTTLFKDR